LGEGGEVLEVVCVWSYLRHQIIALSVVFSYKNSSE
jgi:fermentation-respiration switch protein FrsA (DUF1100 family)